MTATGIAPPVYVDAPSVQRHRFGLFSVSASPETFDRVEAGVEWEPHPGAAAGVADIACDVSDRDGWPLDPIDACDVADVTVTPFVVVGAYSGPGVATRPRDDWQARAREHLRGGEERAVEYAIASGAAEVSPTLSDATDLTGGTAVDVPEGIALLESWLAASHHSPGVLHVPRVIVPYALDRGQVRRDGERIETVLGTGIAAGAGYDLAVRAGHGPSSAGSGEAWLYATPRPRIRRSEVWVGPDRDEWLNRRHDTVEVYAMRAYAVGWDVGAAAVLVNAPDVPDPASPAGAP